MLLKVHKKCASKQYKTPAFSFFNDWPWLDNFSDIESKFDSSCCWFDSMLEFWSMPSFPRFPETDKVFFQVYQNFGKGLYFPILYLYYSIIYFSTF